MNPEPFILVHGPKESVLRDGKIRIGFEIVVYGLFRQFHHYFRNMQ
jgi:hypothetical protein